MEFFDRNPGLCRGPLTPRNGVQWVPVIRISSGIVYNILITGMSYTMDITYKNTIERSKICSYNHITAQIIHECVHNEKRYPEDIQYSGTSISGVSINGEPL